MDVQYLQARYTDKIDNDSFRLLKIDLDLPDSRPNSLIRCALTTHVIGDAPTYNALSYAWNEAQAEGNPTDFGSNADGIDEESTILLDGRRTIVKSNLYQALLEIHQDHDSLSYWWIDAICINQADQEERTSQVSIMHTIFSQASRVVVWLGSDHTGQAYQIREFFRALLQKYSYDEEWSMAKFADFWLHRDDEHAFSESGLPALDHPLWVEVVKFWDRNWFNRVWVHQEVAVAEDLEIRCGATQFTLYELFEISRFHLWSGLCDALLILKMESPTKPIVARRIGCNAMNMGDLQLWATYGLERQEPADFKEAADHMTGSAAGKHPLLRLFANGFLNARRFDASDSRDKIFTLLMLTNQMAEVHDLPRILMESDYSKTQQEVYRDATAWIINESKCLGILCLLAPERLLPDQCSWVPDFTSAPMQPLGMFSKDLAACMGLSHSLPHPELRPSVEGSGLHVGAKYCGTVLDVGDTYDSMVDGGCFELTARLLLNLPVMPYQDVNRLDLWRNTICGPRTSTSTTTERDVFKHWLVFFILRRIRNDFLEGRIKNAREHLARMPMFDLLAGTDDTHMLPDWGFWQETLRDPHAAVKYLEHRPVLDELETGGRILFRTVNQTYVGLGPQSVQSGDELWVVAGSRFPLVLRRVQDEHSDSQDEYARLVVGETYIHDFTRIADRTLPREWQRLRLL